MDLTSEKNWIKAALDNIEDIDLIKSIKEILVNGVNKNLSVTESINNDYSIEDYNKDLDEGSAEIARGEYISIDDLKKRYNLK